MNRLADSDRNLLCSVAVCKTYTFRDPGGFRAVLKLFFDDLFGALLGRRYGR